MVVPLQASAGNIASRTPTETVTIESWWDKLCYLKVSFASPHIQSASDAYFSILQSREGLMDSLELKFDCSLIRNRRCLVQVRQPLPYSLTTNSNVTTHLGQFVSVPKIGLVLPKSPVFFASRLATLRHLFRVAQAFRDHQQDSKYEDIMIRISQVELQMCIYYRSIKSTPPLFEHHTNLELWIQLVDQGDKAKDDIFDSWGLHQNYAFLSGLKQEEENDSSPMENGKISLTEVWSKAAEWGCTGTTLSKVEVIKALEEMHKWLLIQFKYVKMQSVSFNFGSLHNLYFSNLSPLIQRYRASHADRVRDLARDGSQTSSQSSFNAHSRR